jgi:hypothetical protein
MLKRQEQKKRANEVGWVFIACTDLAMPDGDGFAILDFLKKNPHCR